MNTARTPNQKALDVISVYEMLREEVTAPAKRQVLTDMTGSMQKFVVDAMALAEQQGDLQAWSHLADTYAALVQASINLDRVISANDRAAMLSAAIVTQSGVVRPQLQLEEE